MAEFINTIDVRSLYPSSGFWAMTVALTATWF